MNTTLNRGAFLKICLASLATGVLPGCRSKSSAPGPTATIAKDTPVPTPGITPTSLERNPVILPGTETWNIPSKIVGQEYKIDINLPTSYGAGNRFPVLYVTDGHSLFPLVREIYHELNDEHKIPEMIIVGIGYPIEYANLIADLRARDLTPYGYNASSSNPYQQTFTHGTGGGPKFFEFIREELKPSIEAQYYTNPADATLLGHSLGGLFCLYALFQEPAIFTRYIAGSPSIWWADAAIFSAEKAYAKAHDDLPAHLFIGAGSDEGSEGDDVNKFADTLRQRGYPGLQVTTQIFDGEGHVSVVPFFISRGLRAVNL